MSLVKCRLPFCIASGNMLLIYLYYRKALGLIPPLSLCPVSNDRPKFLTKHVLQEVEKFVTDIALWVAMTVRSGLSYTNGLLLLLLVLFWLFVFNLEENINMLWTTYIHLLIGKKRLVVRSIIGLYNHLQAF